MAQETILLELKQAIAVYLITYSPNKLQDIYDTTMYMKSKGYSFETNHVVDPQGEIIWNF